MTAGRAVADPRLAERAQRAYLEQRVRGADQQELLLILYEGLLKHLRLGREALVQAQWEAAHENLSRARRIVTYLLNSLREEGGEISQRLRQLYTYCFENISLANLEKSPARLDSVIAVVSGLNGAWTHVVRSGGGEAERGGDTMEPAGAGEEEAR